MFNGNPRPADSLSEALHRKAALLAEQAAKAEQPTPEQELAQANADIIRLTREKARTEFAAAVEANPALHAANQRAVQDMAARLKPIVDDLFAALDGLPNDVKRTYDDQQAHRSRALTALQAAVTTGVKSETKAYFDMPIDFSNEARQLQNAWPLPDAFVSIANRESNPHRRLITLAIGTVLSGFFLIDAPQDVDIQRNVDTQLEAKITR